MLYFPSISSFATLTLSFHIINFQTGEKKRPSVQRSCAWIIMYKLRLIFFPSFVSSMRQFIQILIHFILFSLVNHKVYDHHVFLLCLDFHFISFHFCSLMLPIIFKHAPIPIQEPLNSKQIHTVRVYSMGMGEEQEDLVWEKWNGIQRAVCRMLKREKKNRSQSVAFCIEQLSYTTKSWEKFDTLHACSLIHSLTLFISISLVFFSPSHVLLARLFSSYSFRALFSLSFYEY